MSDNGVYRYQFTDRPRQRVTVGWQPLTGGLFVESDDRTRYLAGLGSTPPPWAQDLLRIAKVVYAVDKDAERHSGPDRWTRHIRLDIQVVEPARWRPQLDILAELLSMLTSDHWHVTVTGGAKPRADPSPIIDLPPASEVALFSGGLDSAAHAADRARAGGGPLVLVAHYTSSDKSQQRAIHKAIAGFQRPVWLRQFPFQPLRPPRETTNHQRRSRHGELSTRSRGLLFLAAATYVAAAHNVDTVAMPENGQLALNPALTPDRVGACSTRSVHPATLELVNRLLDAVGGTVTVVNPLVRQTKAGICSLAQRAGLDATVLSQTVSCGHSPNRRTGTEYAHCGYCFPCLIRRTGLWTALDGKDPTPYQEDPWDLSPGSTKRADFIAVLNWIATPFTSRDLVADAPLPPACSLTETVAVIEKGRREMHRYLDAVVPSASPYRGSLRAPNDLE